MMSIEICGHICYNIDIKGTQKGATQMKKIIENNKYTADAHAEKHSWNVRAQELDNWIKLTWK